MPGSRILKSRLGLALLPALFILLLQTSALPNTAQDKEKKRVFTDEDEKVEKIPGKWMLISLVDLKQANDYSIPVTVTYINTFYGQGKYEGRVKIMEAKLESHVQKTTRSVQLRWSIVKHEEPDIVLLEGLMPFMEVQIEANSEPALLDIPPIYFNKIVKPLLKDGELSGHLRLVVGVQEVRFADGTAWQRTQQAAFLKTSFNKQPFDLKPRYFGCSSQGADVSGGGLRRCERSKKSTG